MVNRLSTYLFLFFSFIVCLAPASYAKELLEVSVDRTQIHQDDTLEMTVTGKMKLEINFGNLLSLGNLDLPKPDLGSLEEQFEILSQNQKYSVRTINSDTTAEINWVYALAPKTAGNLKIPVIKFKDSESTPISIDVLPGSSPQAAAQNARTFLIAEVDKKQVYVQEQVIYTLKLYYLDQLASGDLSDPKPKNTIQESAGNQKKYTELYNHQRYNVIERKYLFYPQKSGTLNIGKQAFTGSLFGGYGYRSKPVRALSESITVDVKPPADHAGSNWLPAMGLNISEKWSDSSAQIKLGDSVTRTIRIQALGLLGSALPTIKLPETKLFKLYPNTPKVESVENPAGVQAIWEEDVAMVAIKAGTITLPEISLPWWDTNNNVERIARLPARTIEVIDPNAQSAINANFIPENPAQSVSSEIDQASPSSSSIPTRETPLVREASNNTFFYLVIVLLISGWAATTLYLVNRNKNKSDSAPENVNNEKFSNQQLSQLILRIKEELEENNPLVLKSILTWGQNNWPENPIYSLNDVIKKIGDDDFSQAILSIESSLYSGAEHQKKNWETGLIISTLEKQVSEKSKGNNQENALPSFYPQ